MNEMPNKDAFDLDHEQIWQEWPKYLHRRPVNKYHETLLLIVWAIFGGLGGMLVGFGICVAVYGPIW
jgi:hypothetical protein